MCIDDLKVMSREYLSFFNLPTYVSVVARSVRTGKRALDQGSVVWDWDVSDGVVSRTRMRHKQ